MGAVYSVRISLTCIDVQKDSQKIVDGTKEFLNSNNLYKYANFNDVEGAIKAILPDQGSFMFKTSYDRYISASSGFDASYSWETVINDWFSNVIAPIVMMGSEINVYPDEGHYVGVVAGDHTVSWTNFDDSEDGDELELIDDPLEKCIAIIENYLSDEFDNNEPIDRNKLDNIGLLYTTADLKDDEDTDLQVSVDLVNNRMIYEIRGEYNTTDTDQFDSIEDLCNYLEDHCYWDALYSNITSLIPDEYYD